MVDQAQNVNLPPNAAALASALSKFSVDVINAKKGGASGAALMAAIGTDAVADLIGAVSAVQGIGAELSSEPIGVAEAFAIAGFAVARQLTGK